MGDRDAWLDDLIAPVQCTVVGEVHTTGIWQAIGRHDRVTWANGSPEEETWPWEWFPANLGRVGIGPPGQRPRAWFVGTPAGQEVGALQRTMLAVGRGRQELSSLSLAALARLREIVSLAVLTTAG